MSINKVLNQREFEQDTTLKGKYKSYETYVASQLKTTSIHNFSLSSLKSSSNPSDEIRDYFNARHKAFMAKSNELIENYQSLDPVYKNAKSQYSSYQSYINKKGDDAKGTEKTRLNFLKSTASSSENDYDAALKSALYFTHSASQYLS